MLLGWPGRVHTHEVHTPAAYLYASLLVLCCYRGNIAVIVAMFIVGYFSLIYHVPFLSFRLLSYYRLNCCSCLVYVLLSRVILPVDIAHFELWTLRLMTISLRFWLFTLYVCDFRGVYFFNSFGICWTVCYASLTFSIEYNGRNYSDKPGVLSNSSGVSQRLGWTSLLPSVVRNSDADRYH